MKISTKGRYGLRAILALIRSGEKQVSLSAIAQEEDLSLNYLESIFSQMKRADLVTGITGAQGGYRLAKDPSEITVYDVLHTLEGNMSVTEKDASMPPVRQYLTMHVWNVIDERVEQTMRNITLQKLADSSNKTE